MVNHIGEKSQQGLSSSMENNKRKENMLKNQLIEALTKKAKAGDWIHDFVNSDAPQFDGKSKKKRIKMALAAYYAKQNEEVVNEVSKETLKNYIDKASDSASSHSMAAGYLKYSKDPQRKEKAAYHDTENRKRHAGLRLAKKKVGEYKTPSEHVNDYKQTSSKNAAVPNLSNKYTHFIHSDGHKISHNMTASGTDIYHTDNKGNTVHFDDYDKFHKYIKKLHENTEINEMTSIKQMIKEAVEGQVKRGRGRPKKEEGEAGDNHPEMQLRNIKSFGNGNYNHSNGEKTELTRDDANRLLNAVSAHERPDLKLNALMYIHRSADNMKNALDKGKIAMSNTGDDGKSSRPGTYKNKLGVTLPKVRALQEK